MYSISVQYIIKFLNQKCIYIHIYLNLALEVLFMINEVVFDSTIVATHCTTAEVGCSSYIGVATPNAFKQ